MGAQGLIGRDRQVKVLAGEVTRALDSHGGLVLVTGEPGIGKTTLVAQAVADAARRGAVIAIGSCWEGAGAPGCWPWVQVVRALRRDAPAEWASGQAGLRALLGENSGPETDVFQLHDAVTSLLVAASRRRPVVVVLEDLHWADAASLRLLAFVVQHTWFERLLVVGTYRDAEVESLEPVLMPLVAKATTVQLTGLDEAGVAALTARTTGGTPDPDVVAEIHRRSGGNPFFVEQLARLWQGGGSITTMVPGVRAVVERRLKRLPADVIEVLTVAAVVGRQFATEILAACTAFTTAQVDRLLDQAVSARLVTKDGSGFAFTHDLVRETLYTSDESGLRARHAAVARAMDSTPMLPAERARHAYLAAEDLEAGVAVGYLMAAAKDANRRLATEEAALHYQRALEIEPRVEIALELGTMRYLAGDHAEARRLFAEAIALARRIDDDDLIALIGMSLGNLGSRQGIEDMFRDVVQEAHRRLGAGPASLDEAAHDLIEHTAESARRGDDHETLKFSLLSQLGAIWGVRTAAQRVRLTHEMTALAHRSADMELELQAASWRIGALLEQGDPRYLEEHNAFVALAERNGMPVFQHEALLSSYLVATVTGRFEDARAFAERAYELGEQPHLNRRELRLMQLWSVELLRGRFDEVDSLLESMRAENNPQYELFRAVSAVHRGDDATAYVLAGNGFRWLEPLWLRYQAQVAALSRDAGLCESAREALTPLIGSWGVTGSLVVDGPMAHWAAVVDTAQERWDDAVAGFTAAQQSADLLHARPWSVEARLRLAETLLARGASGDAETAAALLAALEPEAADLGMEHVLRQAAALRDSRVAVFSLDSGVWTLGFAGRTVRLPDAKGLRDLRVLIGQAGTEVSAVRLLNPDGGEVSRGDVVLDDAAKAAYRRRLTQLDEEIDRATGRGDDRRAADLDRERQALIEQLRGAIGLGGRSRRLGDDAERARKAVTNRIRDTLQRLDQRHPELAAHLRAAVTTGSSCVYRPAEPISWTL